MSEHWAEFSVPARPLGKSDIVFRVWEDDELFGTLKISYGALDWIPGRSPRSMPFRLSWEKFDQLARENGRRLRPERE
jgi:hypothetical protein